MKKLILSSALGAAVLLVAACGDGAEEAAVDTADTDAMAGSAMADASASADWPAGTRIVDEGGTTYRVNADGTRVELGDWRIVTEGEERYLVNDAGTRIRIDEEGLDIDGFFVFGLLLTTTPVCRSSRPILSLSLITGRQSPREMRSHGSRQ